MNAFDDRPDPRPGVAGEDPFPSEPERAVGATLLGVAFGLLLAFLSRASRRR